MLENIFFTMKNSAVVCNRWYYDCELNLVKLEKITKKKRTIKSNYKEYILKNRKRIFILTKKKLVNLAITEGHLSKIMNMHLN